MNHYELAQRLEISPEQLKKWLKKNGFGNGKRISKKAENQAVLHFNKPVDHPLAHVLEDQRLGLGKVKKPIELSSSSQSSIRVEKRPVRKWEKTHQGESLTKRSTQEQKQMLRQLRGGGKLSMESDSSSLEISSSPSALERTVSNPTSAPIPSEKSESVKVELSIQDDKELTTHTYYKKKYESLLDDFQSLKSEIKTLKLQLEDTKTQAKEDAHSDQLPLESPDLASSTPSPLIWDEFTSYGLEEQEALDTLIELLEHPIKGPNLLYSLQHEHPKTLLQYFSLYCGSQVCADVARPYAKYGLIETSEHLCSICQGSSPRRWYRRTLFEAIRRKEGKIALVGGHSDDHQNIIQLNREYPGMQWFFIGGQYQLKLSEIKSKLQSCTLVVLWAGTHLPHALSNNVKQAAEALDLNVISVPPGQRNIELVCQTLLNSWLGADHLLFQEEF